MHEELIKRLRDIASHDSNIKSNYIGLALLQAADAIEVLSKMEKTTQWIPVTEALPEEAGYYITMTNATGKNNRVIAQEFVKTTVRGKPVERWEWYGRISPWTVTHWMPLPEPPKEVRNCDS